MVGFPNNDVFFISVIMGQDFLKECGLRNESLGS